MERKRISTSAETGAAQEQPLHVKWRPSRLEDVRGHKAAVKSLRAAFASKTRPHSYLFSGPAGTGKTTLARIGAAEVGCDANGIVEVNAASTTGIDDMRALLAPLRYMGFGDKPNKAIVLDECHRLSKPAWDAFLKDAEEAPAHVYFFLCTTEPEKVPSTIVSRCSAYHLQPVRFDDVMDLLEDVCEAERMDTPSKVLAMVARAAEGSPRTALTMLAAVRECDEEEAEVLLRQPLDNKEVIDLCRMMVRGDLKWDKLTATLKALSDTPAETVRIIVVNYLSACAMGARDDREAMRLLDMLERFLKPCNPSDKYGPLLAAFGRIVFP